MDVLVGFLLIGLAWFLGVIAILAGGFWLMIPKGAKAPKPAPAPEPTPVPVAPPAPEQPTTPDYIPRWNRARILREWEELARFQRLLND